MSKNNNTYNKKETHNSPTLVLPENIQYFPQENYTESEAAKWLKVSRITLQRVRFRGEVAFSRVGRNRVLYTRKHLEDYIASREQITVSKNKHYTCN